MHEALNELKKAIKPFRALLDLEAVLESFTLQLGAAQERIALGEKASAAAEAAKAELLRVQEAIDAAKREAAAVKADAEIKAANIVADADRDAAATVQAAQDKAAQIVADAQSSAEAANAKAELAEDRAKVAEDRAEAAEAALAKARAAIAKLKEV